MREDRFAHSVDQILSNISDLERRLDETQCPRQQQRMSRSLRRQHKRLEHMIGFQFRMALHNLCKGAGVEGDFI